jgi:tetratricopeptide (TPR) repeat protein
MRALVFVASLPVMTACATMHARTVEGPEMRIVAQPIGPDGLEVYDAETLFQRALDLLDGHAYADAALYFERLIREFPDDKRVILAHYNRGVTYIHLDRGDEAVTAFDTYLALLPETATAKDKLDGTFKRGQALAVAKRYQEVADVFDTLLGEELTPEDRIEALVDAGIGHYMLGEHDAAGPHRYTAEYRFLEARRLYRQASERARLDVGYFVAQAAFYLAEIARLEFSELKLTFPSAEAIAAAQAEAAKRAAAGSAPPEVTLEKLLGEQLEEKCQRLLRAQYAYLRTIRDEHPGWASASGYNVGQMYVQLHDEMVHLPTPPDLSPDAAALYQKMVRKKILILLTKAQKTWSSTAEMVTRTGAESEWADKTRDSLEHLRAQLLDEIRATDDIDDEGNDVATTPAGVDAS